MMLGGGGGLGLLALIVIAMLFGINPLSLLSQVNVGSPGAVMVGPPGPHDEELKEFVSVVLADTEDVWHRIFAEQGRRYVEPSLVLFSGQVDSACGFADAAVGPFYCPADENVYLDLSFFDDLNHRFGAPGDFAQAYVIAHEVGHHVQRLLGITDQVDALRRRVTEVEANQLSIRLELQADFFAGVWAHYADTALGVVEPGDIEEALNAANAIGDDRLQRRSRGYVVPDSFTHGTSAQRIRWFRKGYESGRMADGDTFSAADL